MSTFYVDETGFTGEDLMSVDQPVFVQATNDLADAEARELLSASFGKTQAPELKYSRMRRSSSGRKAVLSLVRSLAASPEHAGTWIAHKEYAMVILLVEWWMEPLAHRSGLNMYENGANHATANMLFMTLGAFWPPAFRRDLLIHFQRMFRARTPERFIECRRFVEKARRKAASDQDNSNISVAVVPIAWPGARPKSLAASSRHRAPRFSSARAHLACPTPRTMGTSSR